MRDATTKAGIGKRSAAYLLCAMVAFAGFPLPADAEIIGTETVLAAQSRADSLARIGRALELAQVRERMQELGVQSTDVETRLAALTDAELASFAQRLEQAPAGGGALEVIGIVALVLFILELVGIIDIFKTVGKAT
ncbi:MAG: PA2779 family protein [Gammaproteobacteria bacterium]